MSARKALEDSGVAPSEREPRALASYLRGLLGSNEFLFFMELADGYATKWRPSKHLFLDGTGKIEGGLFQ